MTEVKVPMFPPKLEGRMKAFDIEMPAFYPVFDRVLVYPLEKHHQPETTAGGIVLAETTRQRLGAQRGVLIAAGPKAREHMYSHGIELGDIVITARLSPWERQYFSETKRPHRVLVLRSADIVGSEDLRMAYDAGELYMLMNEAGDITIDRRPRNDPEDDIEGT